jgi:hypothetical protein
MIFCSSCLPAAADAQFVECTSEQSHFIDGQPVFGLGLQEGENLHRGHPVSFLFIFGGMEVAGKSSVSCPLKPSDSAPLKHSTMPP